MSAPLQILVTTLGYDDYRGVTAVGRIFAGQIQMGQALACMTVDGRDFAGTRPLLICTSRTETCRSRAGAGR